MRQSLIEDILQPTKQSSKLEIFISCRQLSNFDTISTTDSFVVVKLKSHGKTERQVLRTNVRWNDLQPDYPEILTVQYFFQVKQQLEFEVYHEATPPIFIGSLQTSIGQIFGSPAKGLVKPIVSRQKKQAGKIILRCELVQTSTDKQVELQISTKDLPDNKFLCCFGGTIPFFRIYRKWKTQQILIYQSEPKDNPQHSLFNIFRIPIRRLCGKQSNKPFYVRFYSLTNLGNQLLGQCKFTLSDIKQDSFEYIKNQANENIGTCHIEKMKITTLSNFEDYINAGLQLSLVIAIDFTDSNLSPENPNSLHNKNLAKNQYISALKDVVNILLDYDEDKLVPLYGFGAKVEMPNYSSKKIVSHCFPLNGNENDPNVFELQGVLQTYKKCLQYLKFQSKSYYRKVLQHAMDQCKKFQQKHNQYMILLILTDGQVDDKQEVINLLIECAKLPLSVIIIGIGSGNFSNMVQLDDDSCTMMNQKGQKTLRDLVQFVPFNKYSKNSLQLSRQVLYELPRQVSQYYSLMNLAPHEIKKRQTQLQFQLSKTPINRSQNN